MKDQGTHEGCIEQISRLFREKLFQADLASDEEGLLRMDDWELDEKVQSKVMEIWNQISTENLFSLSDIDGYWEDFYHMFGFHFDSVDYTKDVDLCVEIPSIN